MAFWIGDDSLFAFAFQRADLRHRKSLDIFATLGKEVMNYVDEVDPKK